MVSSMNYYQELNVDPRATTAEIRRAYKRLALLWHPDRNPSREAGERFKTIKHAYDVLIDDKRRRDYDQKSRRTSKAYQCKTTNE
jgi:DnaJ-class molecular chaperone